MAAPMLLVELIGNDATFRARFRDIDNVVVLPATGVFTVANPSGNQQDIVADIDLEGWVTASIHPDTIGVWTVRCRVQGPNGAVEGRFRVKESDLPGAS